ncbi:MAG: hypothetical protein ABIP78_12795 [Pyrinomonadaceae bacterium]
MIFATYLWRAVMIDPNQDKLAADFLLGKLSDDEQAAVEQEFLRDTSVFENILIAENSLTDAYVANRLSSDDRKLFQKRLLISPTQRQRAAFAETLVGYASRLPVDDIPAPLSASNLAALLSRLFSAGPVLSYSLAAAVVVLFAGVAFWWASNNSRPTVDQDLAKAHAPAEFEVPRPGSDERIERNTPLNRPDTDSSLNNKTSTVERNSMPEQAKPSRTRGNGPQLGSTIISTLILQVGSTRDSEAAKSFVLPRETNVVKLKLKFEEGNFSSYFAVIETVDGQQVWRGKALRASENNVPKTVSMTLPARLLKKGDYITRLKGLTKAGVYEPVADYSFSLDRP